LFVTLDRGGHWMRLKANLPTVPVYEIALHPRENAIILATHGRSIWILDDLTPLQEFAKARKSEAYFFSTRPVAQRLLSTNYRNKWYEGNAVFLGENPESGATLSYYLRTTAKDLEITIRDANGNVIRRLSHEDVKDQTRAGVNAVVWDLRVQPLPARPALVQGSGRWDGALAGPLVLPGDYSATITVAGRDVGTDTITVKGDRDIRISDAERKLHFETVMELHRLQAEANDAAETVMAVYEQLKAVRLALQAGNSVPASIQGALDQLTKAIEPLRYRLGVTGSDGGNANVRRQIGRLKFAIMESTSRPTEIQTYMSNEVRVGLAKTIDDVNELIGRLPAFQRELADKHLYAEPLKPILPIKR
jgi:hypothetical protein